MDFMLSKVYWQFILENSFADSWIMEGHVAFNFSFEYFMGGLRLSKTEKMSHFWRPFWLLMSRSLARRSRNILEKPSLDRG